jgi:VWFA-related protein
MKMGAIALLCAFGLNGSNSPAILSLKKLNIVAVDSDGQPVTNLRVSDFQIYEDGKLEKIAFFRFAPKHATVVLIDLLNDRVLSDAVISTQVGTTLKKLASSDDLYLYFLTSQGDLYPIHALPEPGLTGKSAAEPWTRNATVAIDEAVRKFAGFKPLDDHDLQIRFNLTFAALEKLDYQMQLIPGGKNLVWITHGLPLRGPSMTRTFLDFTEPVRRLAEQLKRDQIAVYTVQQSMSGAEPVGTESSQTLDLFTNISGGRAYQTERSDDAIQQARNDAMGSYEIAYYTESLNSDRKTHKILATCARKDVRLLTEREFDAIETQPQSHIEGRAFENASQSPIDSGEIGLRASVMPDPGNANEKRFDLRIRTEDILLREAQERRVGKVSVMFASYIGTGLVEVSQPIPLGVNLTAREYETAARGTLEFHQTVPINGAIEQVRVIVMDRERGAVGSITIPVR